MDQGCAILRGWALPAIFQVCLLQEAIVYNRQMDNKRI